VKPLAIALFYMLYGFGTAAASSLEITPILVEFQGANQAQTITITNRSTQPTKVQIRVFAWSQPAGEDRYEPATDIAFSPPFADIAAGERQVVRLVSRQAAPRGREQAYRIFVDELPSGRGAPGIEIPLRIIVPVFIGVAESQKPSLAWSARLIAQDRLELTARNAGTRRLRVSGLQVISSGAVLSPPAAAATVLSDGAYRWVLPLKRQGLRPGSMIALRADSSDGPIDANVSVAGP